MSNHKKFRKAGSLPNVASPQQKSADGGWYPLKSLILLGQLIYVDLFAFPV